FFFAAAKPVPYDPRNLKNPRSGGAKIALAGPVTNLAVSAIFGILVRIFIFFPVPDAFLTLLALISYVNILLGIFNLIPIPPLDGSRILFAALPQNQTTLNFMYALERWGFFLVLLFVFFGFSLIVPLVNWLFFLFTGQPFGV